MRRMRLPEVWVLGAAALVAVLWAGAARGADAEPAAAPAAAPAPEAAKAAPDTLPYEIPVLVIKYFPVKGDRIDQAVSGDWGETLEATRTKT
ncbi:MAG: hypothetical protein IMZ55_14280, partial [Acidobacteria bacterium]|nr:hypothetical protein [Acidobacteriota bacterium]